MKKINTSLLVSLIGMMSFLTLLVSPVQAQPTEALSDFEAVSPETFDALNPLKIANSPVAAELSTPGGILSRVLLFAFPISGLILFVMLVWGGFEMLSGATSKKSMDAGKQRITAAVGGFFLLFVSFWIIRIVELVFRVKIF